MRKLISAAAMVAGLLAGGLAFGAQVPLPALDAHEAGALRMVLAGAAPGTITIACGGDYCAELQRSVAVIFSEHRWTVHATMYRPGPGDVPHGQFSPYMVGAIRVTACGVSGQKMEDALRWSTARGVVSMNTGPCKGGGAAEVVLTLGGPTG